MGEGKKKVTEIVETELSGFLAENGLELYHTEFLKRGKDWYLEVYVDISEDAFEEGKYVSTDDCEKVSNYLSDRLDELDPIEQNYTLMVSSPGMDRELYEQKHFDRYKGELVDVKLYNKVDGIKEFQGRLKGLEDGTLYIEDENGDVKSYAFDNVAKTCLAVVF